MERPQSGRILAGVSAAIAKRTNTATWVVRLGFIITTFFGGVGILAYLAGWFLMPAEGRSQSPAEGWLTALGTPGRRAGALLIAFAMVILLTGLAPIGLLIAAILVLTGLLLVNDAPPADSNDENQ